jgi:invasion protein IalB
MGRDEKNWKVMLTVPKQVDLSAGVKLTVDNGEPMAVPAEFLNDFGAGRAISISPKLADTVLSALKPGKMLHWHYTMKDGKQADTTIPLKGFGRVFDWAGCALKKLDEAGASKRRSAPAPAAKQ